MYFFSELIKMENELSEEMKMFASEAAKGLVSFCIRNNTVLEDIHAGEVSLTDETMKRLMIECTNNVYIFFLSLFYGEKYYCNAENEITLSEFAQRILMGQSECRNWYDAELPEWVHRMAEYESN